MRPAVFVWLGLMVAPFSTSISSCPEYILDPALYLGRYRFALVGSQPCHHHLDDLSQLRLHE
jgi:hypothetical protein